MRAHSYCSLVHKRLVTYTTQFDTRHTLQGAQQQLLATEAASRLCTSLTSAASDLHGAGSDAIYSIVFCLLGDTARIRLHIRPASCAAAIRYVSSKLANDCS